MSLEPRAFGPPSQTCKDPSHNHLLQPHNHLELIWNFVKYIYLIKILVATILFCWCWLQLISGLYIMQLSYEPGNDVFFCDHFMKWNADTNLKFMSCLDMPGAM